jgi:hypothetical protein
MNLPIAPSLPGAPPFFFLSYSGSYGLCRELPFSFFLETHVACQGHQPFSSSFSFSCGTHYAYRR